MNWTKQFKLKWFVIPPQFTDLKYCHDSYCLRDRGRGNKSESQFLKWLNTQSYLEKVRKCSDWQVRCPLRLPHGTASTQLSLRKQECENEKSLGLSSIGRVALLRSALSLTLLALHSLLKRNTCSVGASKYEIQFSSPKCFYKSRYYPLRAGRPGQLSSARLSCVGTYCTRREETESIRGGKCRKEAERQRETVRKKEREDAVWTRQQRIGAVSSRATEGLNLPKRQLSFLCNLTRTCLTCVWVSGTAQCTESIAHWTENSAVLFFAMCVYYFCTNIALNYDIGLTALKPSSEAMFWLEFSDIEWFDSVVQIREDDDMDVLLHNKENRLLRKQHILARHLLILSIMLE